MLFLFALACLPPADPSGLGHPQDVVPLDPGVQRGTLPNGLTWLIQQNGYPDNRAELRLVVDVGSALEDDDQRGLAHMLEHMAFNGTKHFQEGELVTWFESVGMSFGAHLNASTGFEDTVYKVGIPTDDPATVEKGLLVLRDWAGDMTLNGESIERERGVVLEEWRKGLGTGDRVFRAVAPSLFFGSRYAERLPIGTEDSLRSFAPEALRRFYADWYRPDRMAVIAVGDFDPVQMQALIAAQFTDLAAPPTPRPRPTLSVPPHAEPLVVVVTDPELPTGAVSVTIKIDDPQRPTYEGYHHSLVTSLLSDVLNERLEAIGRKSDGPLLGARAGYQRLSRTEASWSVGAGVRGAAPLETLRVLLVEIERIRRFGPTTAELERARGRLLLVLERNERERLQEPSASATEELIRSFLNGESVPGSVLEASMGRSWLPRISVATLAKAAPAWLPEESRVVQIVLPAGSAPTEANVRGVMAELKAAVIAPPEAEAALGPLLGRLPRPGKVVTRGSIPELEITTWRLANGVEVWVKPTSLKAGEVLLGSWSPGGRAMADDVTWVPARSAADVRKRSGLGALSATALTKRLSGIEASSSTDVGRFEESVSGSAASLEIETMFQLVHLQFTAPRFEEEALAAYRSDKAQRLPKRSTSPDNVFEDAWDELMWQGHPRMIAWAMSDLDRLDLAASRGFFQERLANAADFRFLIVGDTDVATLEPLVTRYLGSLPAAESRESARDDGARRAPGRVEHTVHAGTEPKARYRTAFHGAYEGGWLARNRLQALSDVLQVRLREQLREELGGVYGVTVSQSTATFPFPEYTLTITFGCDPVRLPELKAATLAVVESLRTTPVPESYVDAVREGNRRDRETDVKRNSFWRSSLLSAIERGEDPRELLTYEERNASLTPAEVQAAAARWLDPSSAVSLELLPVEPAP